ncbi:hypothetical protein [Indioceanicola profundi]|uniref:hypothetical protein n=1 Tax=Indioceanicola profundi TaxID=2220096 RepID=UPI000E6ACF17|nr:hypothetical protein [Indioceanicola profundi]
MAKQQDQDRTPDDTIERTSIVTYGLLEQLHGVLSTPEKSDDVNLGMLMGLAMFLDDKIGPFRTERLMKAAPNIILRTDAHVLREQLAQFEPVLTAFGQHLSALASVPQADPVG